MHYPHVIEVKKPRAVQEQPGGEQPQARQSNSDSGTEEQWLETLEKALRGWSAYLKVTLPHVTHLACFEADWHRLVHVLAALLSMEGLSDSASTRKVCTWDNRFRALASCQASAPNSTPAVQVALASLAFFSAVVAPHASSESHPPFMWDAAWAALCDCGKQLAASSTSCPASVRTRFSHTLTAVYRQARPRFTVRAYSALVGLFNALATTPVAATETWPPYFVPPVQAAVLAALPGILPPPSVAGWDVVVELLCTQLQPPDGAQLTVDGEATQELSIRYIWLREVSERTLQVYKTHMPWEIRARSFQALVAALLPGIALRWVEPAAESIAPLLVRDFCALTNMGLPAVHIAAVQENSSSVPTVRSLHLPHLAAIVRHITVCLETRALALAWFVSLCRPRGVCVSHPMVCADLQNVWETLVAAFHACLHPPGQPPRPDSAKKHEAVSQATAESPSNRAEENKLQALVLDCLTDTILTSCGSSQHAAREQLISILDDACTQPGPAAVPCAERLSHLSLRKMFVLCSRGEMLSQGAPCCPCQCRGQASNATADATEASEVECMQMASWRARMTRTWTSRRRRCPFSLLAVTPSLQRTQRTAKRAAHIDVEQLAALRCPAHPPVASPPVTLFATWPAVCCRLYPRCRSCQPS